ncbi:Flagellar motor switch protein FliG [Betaproteobacteria bacterium MOLA814]|jgi:flagellar motor switch protein FliG|nr:Flagellar motor switch protein FliG [Betaproteobacteria bacterium MOLA814]
MAEKDDKKKDAKAPKDGKAGKGGKDTAVAKPAEAVAMSEALQEELAALNGTQRAAVLVLLLGEQQASDIIRYMNPKEVQALGGAMVALSDLSQEVVNAVLDDFVSTLKKQTSLGLGTNEYVEKVLNRALGPDKAASVLSRIMPGQGSKGLEILKWMDARSIAEMIRGEHPQVTAIILSVLDYDVAADVLAFLDPPTRAEIMQRVASLETVQPSAMEELESIMKSQFANNSSAQSSSFGGVKAAAKIMNFAKVDLESSVMAGLTSLDAELTQKIQDNMFTFENLSGVDNRGIQTLMRAVEPDMLMTALKGAADFVQEKFFGNMSTRARAMFMDEMEAKGPLRIADVEEAQKNIMRLAKKMSDAGELMLVGRGDGFV